MTVRALPVQSLPGLVWGVDVSHHQGRINWPAVALAGCSFAIVKLTEGQTGVDRRGLENLDALRQPATRSIRATAYHFARVDTDVDDRLDAQREAESFAEVSERARIDWGSPEQLPPWLDLEWFGTLGPDITRSVERNVDWARAYVDTIERLLGRTPGIYTGPNVWSARFANSALLDRCPLWEVQLGVPPGSPRPIPLRGGDRWVGSIHQYSHTGRVPGVAAAVDLNVTSADGLDLLAQGWRLRQIADPGLELLELDLDVDGLLGLDPTRSQRVANLQGLLLAHGAPIAGLVGPDGRPDGIAGARTRAALQSFRGVDQSAPAFVDASTWLRLLGEGRA